MSATMQGIAAGMGDGTGKKNVFDNNIFFFVGYALGSVIGGLFYKFLGGKKTFMIFMVFGLICGVSHFVIHKTVLRFDRKKMTDYETLT